MAKRKKVEVVSTGAPAWMTTYGDMITLVLTFFVLLFSFSTIDIQKFQLLISAFQDSWGIMERGPSITEPPSNLIDVGSPNNDLGMRQEEEIVLKELHEKINEFIKDEDLIDVVVISIDNKGIMIRFSETVLFDRGSATLKPKAIEILDKLGNILQEIENNIIVEGHTCDLPIRSELFPSNWELSAIRAVNVVRYFSESKGMEARRFSAVGYGEYRPIVVNDLEVNRSSNRRVDIIITP